MKAKELLRMLYKRTLKEIPRQEPACKHFAECGGCEFLDIPYEKQLRAKVSVFKQLIKRKGLSPVFPLKEIEIIASDRELAYRARMDYVYAFNNAGLRRRHSHRFVVDLEECPLISEKGFAAFKRAKELAQDYELESYDYIEHTGFLRYFVVRVTRSGSVMLLLVTKSKDREREIGKIAKALLDGGYVESVYWLLQEGISDVSSGESLQCYGAEYIKETYLGQEFLVAPDIFFQANAGVAEQAYAKIIEHIRQTKAQQVIDCYSGTGVIGQLLADKVESVLAIEENIENVKLAEKNMINNRITKVKNIVADAEIFLQDYKGAIEHLVVNPPRAGLGRRTAESICRIAPEAISYMSCNPVTLASDMDVLREKYEIVECTLFDMFPQTRHFETLVLLRQIRESEINI